MKIKSYNNGFGFVPILVISGILITLTSIVLLFRPASKISQFFMPEQISDENFCRKFTVKNCPSSCRVGPSCGMCLDVGCHQKYSAENSNKNNIKGEIIVTFKNGVSDTEALTLLDKYNLRLKFPENFHKFYYVTLKTNDENIDQYVSRIKELNLPFIKSVDLYGKNRPSVQPWITVNFAPKASEDEIRSILSISENLYIENRMSTGDIVLVPEGNEKPIIEQLKKENIVESAYQNITGRNP